MTTEAIISVGTNSTRALVAALASPPEILLERSAGTRIGEGLREGGELREDAMRRTLEAVRDFNAAIRELADNVSVIATSALRRARNGEAFTSEVQSLTGVQLAIISGDEEARCSYAGAVSGLSDARGAAVVDTGGGSTEYATADDHISCEIGAVRLSEEFPALCGVTGAETLSAAHHAAREALRPMATFERPEQLVICGGSARTACAVIDSATGRYQAMGREQIQELVERLASLSLNERKALRGMVPQRADILLAGAIILDEIFQAARSSRALVSANDLLLGYLLRAERAPARRSSAHER